MSVQTTSSTPYTWYSTPDTNISQQNRLSYTPLERIDVLPDEKNIVQPDAVNQVQRMLLIDDDEIYDDDEEEEEDFTNLPPTNKSNNEHTQYINSIRKTRPLPQIPQRSTSKELPQNMTEVFNDNFKNQNKLTAQQLFRMMCEHRSNNAFNNNSSDEDSAANESDESDDDYYYDGVYALKTQVPSPEISKRSLSLIHSSYHYDHFNTHAYKMMTPVEEVEEEDQLYADYKLEEEQDEEEQDEEEPNFLLEPMDHLSSRDSSSRPLSEISFNAPSLTSASSQSVKSNNDVEEHTGEENHCMQHEEEYQSQQYYNSSSQEIQPQQKLDQQHCYTPLYNPDYVNEKEKQFTPAPQEAEEASLVSDVQRLSQLNQALMTPVLSKSTVTSTPSSDINASINTEYDNINTSSPQAMTSFSLTHDKESIKTYRRMATKTHDKNIQFTYAKYLLQLVSSYNSNAIISKSSSTRDRLQEEAEYWIDKLAKGNHAEALYIKGQWHRHCFGSSLFVGAQYKKVNHNKAVKCFQQAAKLGFTEAHYEMAEYYKFRKEYKKAITSYRLAAIKNHILSLYNLANILLRGLFNQEKDIAQGMIFLKKAADLNKPESARSAYDLACIYSNDFESIGMDSNTVLSSSHSSLSDNLALEYFKKADELDLTVATFRLGRIFEHGHLGTEANTWEAFKYYYRAAEKRHEGAMIELARLYKNGIAGYLNPHPVMAYEWCKRATESGNEVAEFIMGTHYELGVGVPIDNDQALVWYNKSALKGYKPAQEKLDVSTNKRMNMLSKGLENHNKSTGKMYFEDSVRIAEKSRRHRAEQNCQIM